MLVAEVVAVVHVIREDDAALLGSEEGAKEARPMYAAAAWTAGRALRRAEMASNASASRASENHSQLPWVPPALQAPNKDMPQTSALGQWKGALQPGS